MIPNTQPRKENKAARKSPDIDGKTFIKKEFTEEAFKI